MANNIVSEWLRRESQKLADEANSHFGTELEYQIGGDALIAHDYADKLDRLVEADRIINKHFCSIGMVCPLEVVSALAEQHHILNELSIQEEKSNGT